MNINQVRSIVLALVQQEVSRLVIYPYVITNTTDYDSTSDVTMVAVTELTIPVEADNTYTIEYYLIYNSGLAGNSIFYDYTAPADAVITWDEGKPYPEADVIDTDYFAQVRMIVNTNDDAGDVVLRFRTFADTERMTIKAGSVAIVNRAIPIITPI
jgi:hypothetical protein